MLWRDFYQNRKGKKDGEDEANEKDLCLLFVQNLSL
jgi:hypothetical protein